MRLRALLLLLVIGCNPVNHVYAGLFDDEEARKQIAAQQTLIGDLRNQGQVLEARIAKLEEALKNQALLELYSQVETLKLDLSKLRGQVEVLTNENELAQKRQKDFYIDLDNRLRRVEQPSAPVAAAPPAPVAAIPAAVPGTKAAAASVAAPVAAATSPAAPAAGAAPAEIEGRAYEAAYNLFKLGNYQGAIAAFQNFRKNYPASSLAPSAVYWVGNSHYALRDFKSAISVQQSLVSAYPDSAKVPDALLNIASSQQEMNDNAAAKKTLEALIAKYPISDATEKAKRRLGSMK